MIGGGPITEDEGNLTVQNPSGRQPLLSRKANRRTYQSQGRGEGEDDEDNLHDDPLCVWLQILVAGQH